MNIKLKTNNKSIYILYAVFIFSIINIYVPKNLFKLLSLVILLIYMLIRTIKNKEINNIINLELVLIILYLIAFTLTDYSFHSFDLIVFMYLIHYFFKENTISKNEIIRFINITFIIYSLISLLVYLGIIPNYFIINRDTLNIFTENFLGKTIKTFIGAGGSTADVDTYSSIVLICNLLLNENKIIKSIMIIFSGTVLFFTFRYTPMVILVCIIIYYILLSRFNIVNKVVFIIISFMSWFSFYIPSIFKNVIIKDLLFSATHGRSLIWEFYINLISSENLITKIFGYRSNIPIASINWGNGYTINPHNNFLYMMMSFGMLTYIIYFVYLIVLILKQKKIKFMAIALAIFIGGITNGYILSMYNPIYLIIIYYIICFKGEKCK